MQSPRRSLGRNVATYASATTLARDIDVVPIGALGP
jgi:hypothetical protein